MFEFIFKIWYLIAILPFLIFLEGNDKLSDFLKKKNIYSDWDWYYGLLAILVILLVILLIMGYR
ncbi:hypothetical protein A3A03_02970 [Candidatus Nomurabacteria bacterium RIFCSPLOWO2_01_FULL_40_18]|uniref:Uncharacterized protein n=1 Tax=Candidatus Nomurabacteria bacterium RIFCSPLOWO2_01_FULL_40_18 TaxID=1801773 RepID=A0A1F6XIC3_9BACT|nr:MAG: hypothetical protein A3A03_02970 [Candidatus Nomurabacteria bacterium RIFCSPLOWO2_01_FULL_40_18]